MSEFSDTNPPDTGGGWDPYTEVPPVSLSDTVEASPGGGISDDPAPDAEGGWDITAHPETGEEAPEAAAHAETTPPDITPADEGARPVAVTQVHEREADGKGDISPLTDYRGEVERLDERTELFTDRLPLSPEEVRQKYAAWERGDQVSSTVTSIGLIQPTEAEIAALSDPRVKDRNYAPVYEPSAEWRHVARLFSSMERVVEADMGANRLEGNLYNGAKIGNFGKDRFQDLHSDNQESPTIRWTVAVGVGSTIGASGVLDIGDTHHNGDINRDRVEVGPGKQLEPVMFREGEVVRFTGSGDIHGTPTISGTRIFLTTTLFLAPRRR